jgi:O-antigen ligase
MLAPADGPGRAVLRRLAPAETAGAIALLIAYVALRTLDAPHRWLEVWYVAATAFAVAFPYGGLLLVIPVGMFIGPYLVRPGLPAWTIWIVAWALGVGARVAYAGVRDRASVIRTYRNPAMLAALALLVASALSVVTAWRHFGRTIGTDAVYRWLWGPGTALLVLLAVAWLVRDGRIRPLVIAVATGVVGGGVSLVLWFAPAIIRGGAFDWLLGPQVDTTRLHGVTYLATGLEALMIVPAAILAMAALYGRDRRVRLAAVAALVPVSLAIWFTYNRAGLLGAYVIAVVAAWQARPRLGKVLAAVGFMGGLALVPAYMALRGSTLGVGATIPSGQLLAPSDQLRIQGWTAAVRMWQDAPLLGHGFWSFFRLHDEYGSPVLDAPHNEWLRLFGEGGIVAGAAGIAFVVATAWYLSRGRGWLPRAALAAFGCWVLALSFNNILSYDQVSIPLMTVVATGIALVRRERDDRDTVALGAATDPHGPEAPATHVPPTEPLTSVHHPRVLSPRRPGTSVSWRSTTTRPTLSP